MPRARGAAGRLVTTLVADLLLPVIARATRRSDVGARDNKMLT